MVLFHERFLIVNNGNVWIDNLYLRVAKRKRRPLMTFIKIGTPEVVSNGTTATGKVFITRVTLQPDGQGTTIGITADNRAAAAVVHGVLLPHCPCSHASEQPRLGRDLLVVVLHLLPNSSCRCEVGASWTDVAVTLDAGIGGPAAEVAALVARPLPLGEMARVVAQLRCDRGLPQHLPLRVQSVPVVGGVNVLADTAM